MIRFGHTNTGQHLEIKQATLEVLWKHGTRE
jgi:hypothetical protein